MRRFELKIDRTYLTPFDLEFVVHAGSKVVHNDHLTVRREPILFLDANPYEGLDTGASGYATRRQWYSGAKAKSPATRSNAILLQIKIVCSGYLGYNNNTCRQCGWSVMRFKKKKTKYSFMITYHLKLLIKIAV